jgi:hypothetical protein
MPKKTIDYSKCCIYKIEHIEKNDLVYVGHTTNFTKRKWQHKYICKSEKDRLYNLKLYQMIRANGGFEMFRMVEIEKYPCADKREAEKRETEVMKEINATLNAMISYVSNEDKKEKIIVYKKKYYVLNKDILIAKQNEYNKTRIEALKKYKKEHREKNKEKIKEQQKEWYEKNKEMVKAKQKEYYNKSKAKSNSSIEDKPLSL